MPIPIPIPIPIPAPMPVHVPLSPGWQAPAQDGTRL